jgi:acyl-CoA thioester hydrolase
MPRIRVERFTIDHSSIDLNGHVNNQEYVRWMQDIAMAHSDQQGWTTERYSATRTTWVIRSHFIEYVRPAFAGDEILALTWVAEIGTQSSRRKTRFVRARDGKTVVDAETAWVYCDATNGRPTDIVSEVREAFPIVSDEAEIRAEIARC